MKSAVPRSCGSPLKSLVSELYEINKIDEQNIQKLVSCPELAPPSVSATRTAFWLCALALVCNGQRALNKSLCVGVRSL